VFVIQIYVSSTVPSVVSVSRKILVFLKLSTSRESVLCTSAIDALIMLVVLKL
jgi:hypothetical protein